MNKRVKHTMRDVARLAGVSISTVSAVLNGTPKVSDERAKRVRDAMSALDYHPDHIARSLKVGKTHVVGVVIPDIANPFYPELVLGIEDAARQVGYGVLLCNSNEDPLQEQKHLSTLYSRRVDGVLLACSDNSTAYDSLIRRRFPLVFVDRIPTGVSEGAVCADNEEAGYMAAQHLIDLGHERIALLAGNLNLSPHSERLEGFRRAMQAAHLPIREDYLQHGGLQVSDGHESGRNLLTLVDSPTAIIASNNKLLLGLLQALNDLKIHCPDEVSILGFDDYVWNEHFSPKLTTVVQPTYEMGKRAFELLCSRMDPERFPPEDWTRQTLRLKAQLRNRESTAAVSTKTTLTVSSTAEV